MSTAKSLKQWEKGYIAGVLDSDGAILLRRNGRKYNKRALTFVCYLLFVGTPSQVEKIQNILGTSSKIYTHGNRSRLVIGKQDEVTSILKRIYPYLTIKEEANIVFRMRSLHKRYYANKGVPEEVLRERLNLYKRYKQLKCRSGGHTTNWGEFGEILNAYAHGNPEPSSIGDGEGVETSPEIMDSSAPPEREDIVRAQPKG